MKTNDDNPREGRVGESRPTGAGPELRITGLRLPLDHDEAALRAAIVRRLRVADVDLHAYRIFRMGFDARRKAAIVRVYTIDCSVRDAAGVLASLAGDVHVGPAPDTTYRLPADLRAPDALRPVVIGFGPCGIFAALILAQMGLRPIVLERGRDVRQRTADTWGLWRRGVLDAESNVQFGAGGAGTFSDGKLYSQIADPRHLTRKVLHEFVAAGAPDEIGYVAKPHIGTFRLVGVVDNMRQAIEALGGEVRFEQQVVDLLLERDESIADQRHSTHAAEADVRRERRARAQRVRERTHRVRGVQLRDGTQLRADHVVLALGHSARDTFAMLARRGVSMQPKPFSIGVRIEHPQGLIDRARFGTGARNPVLGAADYKLVHHARNGRSVYSFCMCPGGTVVAATSEVERVVTNGMSQYSRNERNANAGIVVGITPADFAPLPARGAPGQSDPADTHPALAGVAFQRYWESRAFELGGGGYHAPGQLLADFLAGQRSSALGRVMPSYRPGVELGDLTDPQRPGLPDYAIEAIREALPAFDRRIRGFAMPDAVLTGVETRTSSPLRITRDADDLQSVNVVGLYPAGEGAGYAGGIMSAGVDGIEVAEALARALTGAMD